MKDKYDSLLWWFEENLFEHKYEGKRDLSLAYEFGDWIGDVDADVLAYHLGIAEGKDEKAFYNKVEQSRQEMLNAVAVYTKTEPMHCWELNQ